MDIQSNLSEFTQLMLEFEKAIHKQFNVSIHKSDIEQLRVDAQGRYSKERFKEYFINKTTIHIIFKYIFIRISEDAHKIVNSKFNKEGIRNWNEISKNYRKDYYTLFNIASEDLRRGKEVGEVFNHNIYDEHTFKLEINVFNKPENNYLEALKEYDFKTLDQSSAVSLLEQLYPTEDRENLEGFLEESKVTTYLMKSLGLL